MRVPFGAHKPEIGLSERIGRGNSAGVISSRLRSECGHSSSGRMCINRGGNSSYVSSVRNGGQLPFRADLNYSRASKCP